MAIFTRIDTNQPVRDGCAITGINPGGQVSKYTGREYDVTDPTSILVYASVNGRYKIAGGTSWERPGGPITP